MARWRVDLTRVDTSYVTIVVEADSLVEASMIAQQRVHEGEVDDAIDVDFGYWEPGEIEEITE